MFYLSTYLQRFTSYCWKTAEQDDKSAFAVPKGSFCDNSQVVVKAPCPIFLKFYSNCHYPIWRTSAKFERNFSRNGMIIKLFSWACVARGGQIIHIWQCLKSYYCQTTLVNNPNISGMLVTLPNIEKITLSILWPSKVMVPQSWLFPALATDFRKFSNLNTVLFLDSFRSYVDELLLIKLSLTLEKFVAKYQKVCEIKRFTHDWVTKAKVPHFSSFFISCQVWPKMSHKPFDILQ